MNGKNVVKAIVSGAAAVSTGVLVYEFVWENFDDVKNVVSDCIKKAAQANIDDKSKN